MKHLSALTHPSQIYMFPADIFHVFPVEPTRYLMAKYKWRPTPQALRNIFILLAIIIIILVMIANGISNMITNIANKRAYKASAKEVAVLREDYKEDGLTSFPSGKINRTVTAKLPNVITDYLWVYDHQTEYDATIRSFAQKNHDFAHFLFLQGNGSTSDPKYKLTESETSGGFPVYYQWDERWAYTEYGDSVMGIDGGCPTILSSAFIGLTGNPSYTPTALAEYAEHNDYYYENYGSAWALVPNAAEDHDLYQEEVILDEEAWHYELDNGRVIVLVMEQNTWCRGEGYILVTSYNKDGYKILDPMSVANTEKTWTYANLQKEVEAIWAIGK